MSLSAFLNNVKGIVLRGLASDPTDNINGSIWHNETDGELKAYVGDAVVTINTGAAGTPITAQDEGVTLTTDMNLINFVGAGVTATNVGDAVTVTIPGGGSATGDTDTLAFFDAAGNLSSNTDIIVDEVDGRFTFAVATGGGGITSFGTGTLIQGIADTNGTLSVNGTGSAVFGSSTNNSVLSANNGFVFGGADGALSAISASGGGAAQGIALAGGVIEGTNLGAHGLGYVTGSSSEISATGTGSTAQGAAEGGGLISSTGEGSLASGHVDGVGAALISGNQGSVALGAAIGSSNTINATGIGSVAMGSASLGTNSTVTASGRGAIAFGLSNGFSINAAADGSLSGGYANGADVISNGAGSLAFGNDLDVSGVYSQALGVGHVNTSDNCLAVGHYADVAGVASSPSATDTLLAIGNGVIGVPANAFSVDRDGRVVTTASRIDQVTLPAIGDITVNARTDRRILLDVSGSGNSWNINLPAGEDGLVFKFSPRSGGGTDTYTLVPNGLDVLDTQVAALFLDGTSSQEIIFFGGTWYRN